MLPAVSRAREGHRLTLAGVGAQLPSGRALFYVSASGILHKFIKYAELIYFNTLRPIPTPTGSMALKLTIGWLFWFFSPGLMDIFYVTLSKRGGSSPPPGNVGHSRSGATTLPSVRGSPRFITYF